MSHSRSRQVSAILVLAASAVLAAQENPYRTIENWARMPEGRTWGATSAVEIDRDGNSIWVAERCGANSCVGSNLPTVLKFDASGKLVASFGAGMFIFPHGIHVDRGGNIWIADGMPPGRGTPPARMGHTVVKFSPEGKVLMTLGTPGGATEPGYFFQPNDVLVAPDGAIFVAEGHGGANSRILKFTKDGRLIKTWGKKGTAPGEFDQPHALAMDSKGRLFVGDRGNNRIQIFDQEGNFLEQWTEFSRPSGIYIDKDDTIYATDSESGSVARDRTDWKRGIRIGKISDRKVISFIPDPNQNATGTSAAEGVAVDAAGNIYGAEVGSKSLKKYVRR
jgi:DNA-binding beta-propeller fold protein YncE